MAEHDDDESKPTTKDPDRTAILERRKRFIALALSGLSTAACTPGSPQNKPDPCLKGGTPRQQDDEDGADGVDGADGEDGVPPHPCLSMPPPPDPPPQPCLKVAPPDPPPDPPPQPCLKVAPPADTGEDDEEPKPKPQPCLSKPRPCLKKAAPDEPL